MKHFTLILLGVAFGVLGTMSVLRGGRTAESQRQGVVQATSSGSEQGATAKRRSSGTSGAAPITWALLPGETTAEFQARLKAAGVPLEVVADILRGIADRDHKGRLVALKLTGVETNWMPYRELVGRQKQAEAISSEKAKSDEAEGIVPKRFEFLSAEKYLAAKRIEDQARGQREALLGAPLDAATRDAKLREARLEKVAQLRATMDDREYIQYAIKMEPLMAAYAGVVRFSEPTEAEFMKLTAIYERHLEAFSMTREALAKGPKRIEEQAPFWEEVRALLGEERLAAYRESTSPAVRGAIRVATDAGLTVEHGRWLLQTDRAYSQAISAVPSTDPARRAAMIVEFEATIQKQLGTGALANYRDSMGTWLRMEKNKTMMEARAQGKELPAGFSGR